nr:sugar phosphate nucleotidyltransferase [uncultured Allomuricauda sp.]
MKSHTTLIILAGGASSRMKKTDTSNQGDLTQEEIKQANERSKGLISVGKDKRPFMDYLLNNAQKAGYKYIYIVVGANATLFKEYYGGKDSENNFHGLWISFATQHITKDRIKPLGTADAVFQAIEQYPELKMATYSVCNSDNLYSIAALKALRETNSPNAFISYDRDSLEFTKERISRFALAKLNDEGHLQQIVEKPDLSLIDNYKDADGKLRVSMNIFKFDGIMFYEYLKNCPLNEVRNEKELPTALLNMIQDYPNTAIGVPFSEHVPDLTAKSDIIAVKQYLEKKHEKLNW